MSESDLLAALGGAAVSFEVVPGVTLALRPLSMTDAGEYQRYRKDHGVDPVGAVIKLVAMSASGPDGKPLTEEIVGKLPASKVEMIAQRIAQLNGWGDAAGN